MSDLLQRVTQVFQRVLDDDELAVTRETTAQDVEGWDSVTHVTLLVNCERAFGIKVRSSEVAGLKNVGELVDLIAAKQAPRTA
jgi:acyl carrier protein